MEDFSMRKLTLFAMILAIMAFAGLGCQDSSNPMDYEIVDLSSELTASKITLPPGAVFESATFFIYAREAINQPVNIHRITADWDELVVTWANFDGAFDATVEGTFTPPMPGWYDTDVTALVQAWLDGTHANFGLLLDQGELNFPRMIYYSKDAPGNHPYIEFCYSVDGVVMCENLIAIGDSYIYELVPDRNNGRDSLLYTGWIGPNDLEKQALLRFELPDVEEPPDEGCTLTIGYWKTHAGFGPQADVLSQYLPIWLGNEGGTKSLEVTDAAMAVDILKMKTFGRNRNGITKLYAQLLAAKLNVAHGATDSDAADIISAADDFLAAHDWTDWDALVEADDDYFDLVHYWQSTLDSYNKGEIGPGHCDAYDDDMEDDDCNHHEGEKPRKGKRNHHRRRH